MSRPVLGAPAGSTSLGRAIDLNYPSNVFAVVGAVAASAAAFALSLDDGLVEGAAAGAVAGIAAFTAWAIGRELDPDHPSTGAVALVMAGVAALLERPALLAVFGVLLAARLAVGSTGVRPAPIDRVVLVATAAALGLQPVAWPALVVLVVASAFRERSLPFAVLMALAGTVAAAAFAEAPEWTTPVSGEWAWLGAALVAGIVAVALASAPKSTDDLGRAPLALASLRVSRGLAVVAVAGTAALVGGVAAGALAPVSGALLAAGGTSLWRLRSRARG